MSRDESATRTRILRATVQMLEQRGGRGVRMADIARQSGISRQAVYLHFASRAELLAAATRFLDAELDLDKRLAASRAARSGTERLAAFVAFWGGYGVHCIDPDTGRSLEKVSVPVAKTTACWFGGEQLDELYITTASVREDAASLRAYPLAGSLFVCRPGAAGHPTTACSL